MNQLLIITISLLKELYMNRVEIPFNLVSENLKCHHTRKESLGKLPPLRDHFYL